jgi:hypothetical protein
VELRGIGGKLYNQNRRQISNSPREEKIKEMMQARKKNDTSKFHNDVITRKLKTLIL